MSKVYIYGLANPETGVVRYVGKTNNLHRRKNEHHIDGANHKTRWLDYLKDSGLEPEMKILEEVSGNDDWRARELFWLRKIIDEGTTVVNGWIDINAATETYCCSRFLWEGLFPPYLDGFRFDFTEGIGDEDSS